MSLAKDTVLYLFFQKHILEFLFSEDLLRFLASAHEVRHHVFRWSEWQVLIGFEVFLRQLASNLVCEALELPEAHPVVVDARSVDHRFGHVYALLVVSGQEYHALGRGVLDGSGETNIITVVGIL